jgi:predicted deacylase
VGGVDLLRGEIGHVQILEAREEVPPAALLPAAPLEVTVVRGSRPGPRLFLTGGVHGDELNGIEIVRSASRRFDPGRLAGDLICVPVVNVPGFLARSRYLPDKTDLNRCFPGSERGAPAARLAHRLMREVVQQCDFGIDFHTAARGRSNIPHVRGDMNRPGVRAIARAFGTRIVVHKRGHARSLRRAATEAGVPTIVFEAGATGRFQPGAGRRGLRGLENVLRELGMLGGRRRRPAFQVVVRRSVWVRAPGEGVWELAVRPGDLVYEGQEIGTGADPVGAENFRAVSPVTGLVIGASLDAACEPGAPLCHIVRLAKTLATVERHLQERAQG